MKRRNFLAATAASTCLLSPLSNRGAHANDSKQHRVAVMGHTGRGNYGHDLDTAWLRLPKAQLVAVADADGKGLEAAVKRLKLERGYLDYREMLAVEKPEYVSVAPRFLDQHHDMVLASVQAGVQGIYIEKPFCRSPAEADKIVDVCREHNVKLAIAHRNRYHPALPVVNRLIEEGLIGQLLEMRGRGKEDHRGGSLDLWVLGTHLANLMNYFAGTPIACTATVLKDKRLVVRSDIQEGAEAVGPLAGNEVHARFDFSSGVVGYFDSIANAGQKEAGFGLQLIGTKGIIDLRIDTEPLAHFLPGSPFLPTKDARSWIPISSVGLGETEPIADLAKKVASHELALIDLTHAVEEDRQPLCDAVQGRTTIEMVTAVFESHRLGGNRITWPITYRDNPFQNL